MNDGTLTLTLFMLWILTNDTNSAFALDHFALFANRLDRCSYLHDESSFHLMWPKAKTVFEKQLFFACTGAGGMRVRQHLRTNMQAIL